MTKVAIVGTCPSSRMLAQELPPDWEIWTTSPDNIARFSRVDRWFELHGDVDFDWHADGQNFGPYISWLNQQTFRIYAQDKRLIQNAIVFPAEDMIKKFGGYWFTSSMAWMMAFAIDEGVEAIGLYGMDMAAKSEYHAQKPGIHRFIELAEERGIEVHAPPQCEVLQPPPLYGYSLCTPMGRKMKVREWETRAMINRLESELDTTRLKLQHFYGVLDDIDWAQQTWTGQAVPMSREESKKEADQKIHKFPLKTFGGE